CQHERDGRHHEHASIDVKRGAHPELSNVPPLAPPDECVEPPSPPEEDLLGAGAGAGVAGAGAGSRVLAGGAELLGGGADVSGAGARAAGALAERVEGLATGLGRGTSTTGIGA